MVTKHALHAWERLALKDYHHSFKFGCFGLSQTDVAICSQSSKKWKSKTLEICGIADSSYDAGDLKR